MAALRFCAALAILLGWGALDASAQFDRNWLSVGSLHNWYSAGGSEIEHGFVARQQFGLHWPGIYRLRDSQAAKGLWIGARNARDAQGNTWPVRVVHIGPRVRGVGEMFPVHWETVSRYPASEVFVNGIVSEGAQHGAVDRVDPTIPADRMIINRVNTLLGVTMERRIMQFEQEWHDNYHVIEYIFTNTGKTGPTDEVTLPNNTVQDLKIFLQWRWSVAAETRYVIGNATGWGMHTMIDRRGDGLRDDPPGEDFRAQFAWHGHFPAFTAYNPVGGPILPQALPASQITAADTLGRLGASHFVGSMTLHADRSPADRTDDWAQPRTRNYFDSDHPLMSSNSAFDQDRMRREYEELMTQGIQSPRHAFLIEPSGDAGFKNPTRNPSMGTDGGYSAGTGYGPYTLAPGESIRFVIVEAAAGLSREANRILGRQYLLAGAGRDQAQLEYAFGGATHRMTKNEWVFTSRDSLMQTFRRARAAFQNEWDIPRPPAAPALFEVRSGGNAIFLNWETHQGAQNPDRWEVFRARNAYDSTYVMVASVPGTAREFTDDTPIRGIDYFYYLQAVNDGGNDGRGMTPANRPLRSSRYHTQSFQAARLLRPPGPSVSRGSIALQTNQVQHGRNELEVVYAAELGGRPRGFQLVDARIVKTVCAEVTQAGCARTSEVVVPGANIPVDFVDGNVGATAIVPIEVSRVDDALGFRLDIGFLSLNNRDEVRLSLNGQQLAVPEEVVGPMNPMEAIRVVPNPFNLSSQADVRWPGRPEDRLGFLNVPGRATIQIFSELGELVDTILHRDGSGDAYWNHTTSAGQLVVSGVYIAVITDDETGERATRKFVIIR